MKSMLRFGSALALSLTSLAGLAGCSSLGSISAAYDDIDYERVAQVERKALRDSAQIVWVQMPRKSVAYQSPSTPPAVAPTSP